MSKPVILTIDNVRIIKFNEMNLAVERYEEVFIPKNKQKEMRWVFYGYKSTVLGALKFISRNELLVNESQISSINDYVKQVKESNNKILNLKEIDQI